MSTTITIKIQASLQRATAETCKRFNKPLATYELLDPLGDRIAWIDGNKTESLARIEAYDILAEPLLSDHYCLDTID